MTKSVTYRGLSDIRALSKSDLASVGVEGFTDTGFRRDQPTIVSNEVADALVESPHLFGEFVINSATKPAEPALFDLPTEASVKRAAK